VNSSSVTVIIPTKNRYDALANALESIAQQTIAPREIIVVDQTPGANGTEAKLRELLRESVALDYIWDPRITGLAMARNVAMERAHGEILLFIDDDVTLYPDFIERLLKCYKELPEATGISGIPDNYSPPGKFFYYWSRVFTRGPFWNDRYPAYWDATKLSKPVRVTQMSGGMMSVRRAALNGARFDENLSGVCDGEDVDFCMHLKGTYFIEPRCKLTHHFSTNGRERDHWTRRHARAYTYLYLRNWRKHRLAYAWLSVGWFFAAALGCASRRSFASLRSMLAGRAEGRQCAGSAAPPRAERGALSRLPKP